MTQAASADIKQRQRTLKAAGFDPGPVDGVDGPSTQRAQRHYEEALANAKRITALQRMLTEQGLNPGPIDGIYGPATRAAEIAFNRRELILQGNIDPQGNVRSRIAEAARSCIGIREVGNNSGAEVNAILDAVGLKGTRNPYCAAFVAFVGDMAVGREANPYPRSAWSPDMVVAPTWTKLLGGRTPKPADVFGIYFGSKGRVAHAGLILEWPEAGKHCLTIEANTSESGAVGSERDREGDGVYMKRRNKTDIFSVRDWIG